MNENDKFFVCRICGEFISDDEWNDDDICDDCLKGEL